MNLIENNQIDYKTLYGSWAGAFGFFQFMPSTIKNHAKSYLARFVQKQGYLTNVRMTD